MCIRDSRKAEVRYESFMAEDADYLIVAFGTVGRIAQSAIRQARADGIKVGLFRPISLWPYPEDALDQLVDQVQGILVVEMNAGQMLDDVTRIVRQRVPVRFLGRMGGMIPLPEDILPELRHLEALCNREDAGDVLTQADRLVKALA